MPELPEAEANRLRIERSCLHRTIEAADLGDDTSYIELPGDNERKRLAGHQFTATQRHGKLVFAGSASGPWIAVHLGMSGKLLPFDAGEEPPDHTKFVIRFEGKRRLAFRCPRKLGWLRVVDNPQAELDRLGFGPDALAMNCDGFCAVVGSTNGTVKGALLDQHKLAGVGNLWSDEILYRIGIAPQHKASALGRAQLEQMFDAMRTLLSAAVSAEADYSKLPDDYLVRHREKGTSCPLCGGKIRTAKVSGRTAYFCADHQS
ncbi:Fpg/Nei family DNA glycosylase [Croceibacterium aestuarii]|uniref:Fpg/Nei family DNA glycosylase n=1 Tax=Croceibacterium aestuarii TaxID=3064139 RepID=UPI00272E2158|nr:DNA-formamidopyrimidine glycosylase family protein [Croceibacterium sp. D39]